MRMMTFYCKAINNARCYRAIGKALRCAGAARSVSDEQYEIMLTIAGARIRYMIEED